MVDSFKTISQNSPEALFKEKGSKFYGYAFPITSEEEVQTCIHRLKKKHATAGHFCFAWQLGVDNKRFRSSDDGEPNNSAGLPIYGQIQSFELTNILIVIVRYFGGTKLGVGGLIQAYKSAARQTFEHSNIVEKTLNDRYKLRFSYEQMNAVMRFVKERQLSVISQEMEMSCELIFEVRKRESANVIAKLQAFHKIQWEKLEI